MRALVILLQTLVDILTLSSLVLTQSWRTRSVLARQTVLQKCQTFRTDTSVASYCVHTIVRTVVLVLETLVEILTSLPVTLYNESLGAATLERILMFFADVRAISQSARVNRNTRSLIIPYYRSRRTSAFVRSLNIDTLVGTLMSAFQALVHILASLRVVAQQETERTIASKSSIFVRTLVRTSVFIVDTLVYVLASEIVLGQLVSLATRATVATNRVHANLAARVSNVQTLVHV